jgi:hypothetical protein
VQLIALREKALQNSKTIDAQDMPFLKKSGRYPLVWMVLFLNGMKTEVLRTQCAFWKDILYQWRGYQISEANGQ